jgi:hypothetical protein
MMFWEWDVGNGHLGLVALSTWMVGSHRKSIESIDWAVDWRSDAGLEKHLSKSMSGFAE